MSKSFQKSCESLQNNTRIHETLRYLRRARAKEVFPACTFPSYEL